MDNEFIRKRITELRIKKGVSEYKMSLDLGHSEIVDHDDPKFVQMLHGLKVHE